MWRVVVTHLSNPPVTVRHDIVTGTPRQPSRRSRQESHQAAVVVHGVDSREVLIHMDSSMHSTPASSSRKRPRENETESQRIKREKAAERQRRKRERDRNSGAGSMSMMGFSQTDHHQHMQQQAQQQAQQHAHVQSIPVPVQQAPVIDYRTSTDYNNQPDLTPEEMARRDRVRAAARERQRKHRLLVKQRKMRELGLDMGNEIMPGMEEVHYRVNADGQYQQVLPTNYNNRHNNRRRPWVTFASTLLLSFSCAPLLKQHLLRTLHMTNEELASLEPILAEAWDRWDVARRTHYAEQAAKAGLAPPNLGPPYPVDLSHEAQAQAHAQQPPYALPATSTDATHPTTNEFRARFHRPLVAPTPFRTYAPEQQQQQQQAAPPPAAASTATASAEAIDPHLANGEQTGATNSNSTGNSNSNSNGNGSQVNGSVNGNGASSGKSDSPGSGDASFVGDDPDFG
ncbi:hypothetical protein LshimejAT787_0200780 [Lyophyllum shimeji]|uniref:Uncharacterized protein n=1 Tax=Lyophyllum shimeji TaxID=47721 RepID=A0A9P3PEN2_LYOSH|nr:hypothetical protein LshimejAT787_0200780 [Lyophyllum shimeji]